MKIPIDLRWKATGRTLGQGGQATVVEVQDSRDEHPGNYALKGLASGKPAKAYERFVREIDALRSITHPGIIRVVDHSVPDCDFHFYVMELLEGVHPLKKLLGTPHNPYFGDVLASLSLFIDLLSAIEACEKAGIVHRDLSPSNTLILPNKSPKLIDFGICRVQDAETITLTDEGVGTQNYMAPECESGATNGKITSQAGYLLSGQDLWSAITNQQAFAREAPVFGHKSLKALFPEIPQRGICIMSLKAIRRARASVEDGGRMLCQRCVISTHDHGVIPTPRVASREVSTLRLRHSWQF